MNIFRHAIPSAPPADIVAWARDNVKVNGGRTSFDPERTPQIIEPLRAMAHDPLLRIGTFVKPVQIGGSTLGEVFGAWVCAFWNGFLQLNWEDDEKSDDRWKDRILPVYESCKDIRFEGKRFEVTNGEIRLANIIVRCQGVFSEKNLDSDTVPFQINEEIHSWKPGHLTKARARQTQVWNFKALDISNAGTVGDQLHSAFEDGTQEMWEVLCPGCSNLNHKANHVYHEMRTRWEDNHPELGGLRYDSDGCKMSNGRFNYNKLEKTLRFQMPCGFIVHDHPVARRALSGRYSKPKNEGAHLSHRSWNFDAVSCATIRWLDLVREKHAALRARRAGDNEPFRRYITERECRFYDEDQLPFQGQIITTSSAYVNRKGLRNESAKIWAADWQQGFKHLGELTHYWLVIESVLENCSSQVIFAGKVSDEMELLATLREHGITDADAGGIADGFIDASKNTKHILSFCLRNGINAVVGGDQGQRGFRWPDGSWQYFSQRKYIWRELNYPEPKYPLRATREGWVEDAAEPFIIRYNKAGLLKNHFFIRELKANVLQNNPEATPEDYIERVIPEDIGEDYLQHHEAWERDHSAKGPRKMGDVEGFKQTRRADHLMSCTTYIDLMKDLSGLLGARLQKLGIKPTSTPEEK